MKVRSATRKRMVGLVLAAAMAATAIAGCSDPTKTDVASTPAVASTTAAASAASSAPSSAATSAATTASAGSAGSSSADTAAGSSTAAVSSTAAGEQPVKGGSITIAIDAEPTGYDPTTGTVPSNGASSIPFAIYTTLTSLTADGSYQPFLAESVTPNDKATVWTIKIRSGALFADGTPIDAKAVVFNLERIQKTGLAYGQVKSFAATDDLTVTITMNAPWSALPAILGSQAGWLASPTAIQKEGKDFATKPVGSGPYMISELVPGDHITLVKNPKYWRGDVAYLDSVTFRPVADADSRLAALQAGDVDAAEVDAGSAKTADLAGKGFTVAEQSAGTDLVYLNTGTPALSDVRVRKALALATDRDALIKSIWKGVGTAADSPMAADSPFFASVDYPKYDPAAAQALLTEYGQPVAITLSFSNDPIQQLESQALQSMWQAVGVQVTLGTPQEAGSYAQTVIGKKFEAAIFGFPSFVDPDKWFGVIFKSQAVLNVSNYKDPVIDAAIDKGGQLTDLAARKAQYAIVQQQLAQQFYALFIRSTVQSQAFRAGVHGANGLILPGGQTVPFGIDAGVPFTVETMWSTPK